MDSRLARPERPESAAALEQIRSWRQRVETEWAEADRAGKRQSDLPDRLHWLENWQQEIGGTIARELDEPDSPKKFQEFFEAAKDQNSLSHEIGLLQHEFRQQLEKTSDTEERPLLEAGLEELDRLRDDSGAVGQNLHALRGKEALGGVDSLLQRLHRLRINLSPCEVIVREAERKQAMLCELNSGAEISDADSSQQALEQQKVADWMPLAVSRAEQWLEKEKQGAFSTSGEAGEAEQFEAYKETMRRAVQYGPEIQTQAEEASRHLLDQAFDEARPQQQQALELLRKILEPLQNQQDQDQQNQDQQGQQGQQQNQGGKGEQKPSQQSQEQDQKDREKQAREDQPSPKQDPDDAEKDDKEHREPKSGDQDEEREKAESKLRQVKRRQQEAQEKRERIRALLMQLEPVDKDW